MKRAILCIVFVLCLVLGMFAGCSDNTNTDQTPTGTPATDNLGTDTTPGNDSEEEGKYGGTLRLGVSAFSNDFFPMTYARPGDFGAAPAVESLGLIDAEGNVSGLLAEDFIIDADAPSLTIKLREGINFSDGSELTAEVLAWHLEMYEANGSVTRLCNPTDWEVVDKYTLLINFEEYSSEWMDNYPALRIVSKATYDKEGLEYMQTHAIGTGPFIMTDYVEGTSVSYVRNDNYWQEGLPYLDAIEITLIADTNTQLTAMLNGEIDYLSVNLGSMKTQLDNAPGIEMIAGVNPSMANIMIIQINTADENSPFYDVEVRRAALTALDRDASASAIMEGIAYGLNQYAAEGSYAYIEDESKLYSTYDYDPELAKQMLADAGYPNGFDNKIYVSANREKHAVALKSYMDAVGINTEIQLQDNSSNLEAQRNGNWDYMLIQNCTLTSFNYCYSYNRYFTALRVFGVKALRTFDEFDALVNAAKVCVDIEDLKEATQKCTLWMNENLPTLPWFVSYSYRYGVENLRGFEDFTDNSNIQSYARTYFEA